jgi:hypothetical protein
MTKQRFIFTAKIWQSKDFPLHKYYKAKIILYKKWQTKDLSWQKYDKVKICFGKNLTK